MQPVKTLAPRQDASLLTRLHSITERHGLSNVFNVSVAHANGAWFAAFRAERRRGERPFRAFTAMLPAFGEPSVTDLTASNADWGVANVADPKLLVLDENVFVTFNTGYSSSEPNQVYLQRVTPEVGAPRRCVLEERQIVEKNWAFYTGPDGRLRALYSASPQLVTLRSEGDLGDGTGDLRFSRDMSTPTSIPTPLSIGTQLLTPPVGPRLVVLHRKVQVRGKRLYFGKVARFDAERGNLQVSPVRLIHSLRSSIPPHRRPNPNLLSATYFAGLASEGDDLILSYGINDARFGVARTKESDIWP